MAKNSNFQNLKRKLILHRLGAQVEQGELIDEVYTLLQPNVSVIIKDGADDDVLCHIDNEGHIIYCTHDSKNTNKRSLFVSHKYGHMIEVKLRYLVGSGKTYREDFEYMENVLKDIFKGYGISFDYFYYSKFSDLIVYLQRKYNLRDFKKFKF